MDKNRSDRSTRGYDLTYNRLYLKKFLNREGLGFSKAYFAKHVRPHAIKKVY